MCVELAGLLKDHCQHSLDTGFGLGGGWGGNSCRVSITVTVIPVM